MQDRWLSACRTFAVLLPPPIFVLSLTARTTVAMNEPLTELAPPEIAVSPISANGR